jgi:hypothetical protein
LDNDLEKHNISSVTETHKSGAFLPARHYSVCPVADNYTALGDAAFAVSPVDGAGIQGGMITGLLAIEQYQFCKTNGLEPTQENLWPLINAYHNYSFPKTNWTHGASVSSLIALKPMLQNLKSEEFDFLLKCLHKGFLEDIYKISIKNILPMSFSLIKVFLNWSLGKRITHSVILFSKLKKHFLVYPKLMSQFPEWKLKLDELLVQIEVRK